MDTVMEFLRLNGYGIYVWPAFAVAALVLAWMAASTFSRLRASERELARLQGPRAGERR